MILTVCNKFYLLLSRMIFCVFDSGDFFSPLPNIRFFDDHFFRPPHIVQRVSQPQTTQENEQPQNNMNDWNENNSTRVAYVFFITFNFAQLSEMLWEWKEFSTLLIIFLLLFTWFFYTKKNNTLTEYSFLRWKRSGDHNKNYRIIANRELL